MKSEEPEHHYSRASPVCELLSAALNRPTSSSHPLPLSCSMQILGKLTSLPFQACKHHISSLDAQPSLSGGVLVFVTGQLLVSAASPGCELQAVSWQGAAAGGSHWSGGDADCCCRCEIPAANWHAHAGLRWRRSPCSPAHLSLCALPLLPLPACLPFVQPDGETNPLKFSQTFHLAPVGGSYVVTNGETCGGEG